MNQADVTDSLSHERINTIANALAQSVRKSLRAQGYCNASKPVDGAPQYHIMASNWEIRNVKTDSPYLVLHYSIILDGVRGKQESYVAL